MKFVVKTDVSVTVSAEKKIPTMDVVGEAKHESKTGGEEADTDTVDTCLEKKIAPFWWEGCGWHRRRATGEKNGETVGQKRLSPKAEKVCSTASLEDEDVPTKKRKESRDGVETKAVERRRRSRPVRT